MIFYKAFVRKKDEKYQAVLVEFKIDSEGGYRAPYLMIVEGQGGFDTYLQAKIYIMQRKEHYETGRDSGWQEVN